MHEQQLSLYQCAVPQPAASANQGQTRQAASKGQCTAATTHTHTHAHTHTHTHTRARARTHTPFPQKQSWDSQQQHTAHKIQSSEMQSSENQSQVSVNTVLHESSGMGEHSQVSKKPVWWHHLTVPHVCKCLLHIFPSCSLSVAEPKESMTDTCLPISSWLVLHLCPS